MICTSVYSIQELRDIQGIKGSIERQRSVTANCPTQGRYSISVPPSEVDSMTNQNAAGYHQNEKTKKQGSAQTHS